MVECLWGEVRILRSLRHNQAMALPTPVCSAGAVALFRVLVSRETLQCCAFTGKVVVITTRLITVAGGMVTVRSGMVMDR